MLNFDCDFEEVNYMPRHHVECNHDECSRTFARHSEDRRKCAECNAPLCDQHEDDNRFSFCGEACTDEFYSKHCRFCTEESATGFCDEECEEGYYTGRKTGQVIAA